MKIISWNVAGFRACLKKGFEDFFYNEEADIYCLQEVKAELSEIDFAPKDYFCYINRRFRFRFFCSALKWLRLMMGY